MEPSLISRAVSDSLTWTAPIILACIALYVWTYYVRAYFISERNRVLLEISVPKDAVIPRELMDEVLLALHQMGVKRNWREWIFVGSVRPWFSLEVVGEGGVVRFFIWTERVYTEIIRTAFTGRSSGISVTEAADYAKELRYQPKRGDLALYGLLYAKENDAAAYSMRLPISFLETLERGERVWIQILIRATRVGGKLELCFEAGIRALYIAEGDAYNATRIYTLEHALKGFAPAKTSEILYPWQDVANIRTTFRPATFYNAYVRRNYFYPPHARRGFLLTQHEIGGLYPSEETAIPLLSAHIVPVSSLAHRLEPPANLPV